MHQFELPKDVIERAVARQGRVHSFESMDGPATALIVIDMQNYFMKEGQPAAFATARDIVPNVNRLAKAMRRAGGSVIWIQTESGLETDMVKPDGWWALREKYRPENWEKRRVGLSDGTEGYALWPGLEVVAEDQTVIKRRYSAFVQGASNLEEILRGRHIDSIVITGVATNVCCESTGRDAMMIGFRTLMVSDGNAAGSDEIHRASLIGFYSTFGDVQTTDEVIALLKASRQTTADAAE